jgi:hypothetical protein
VEQPCRAEFAGLRITTFFPHVLDMFSGVRRHDGRLVRCDVERMQRRGDGLGRQRARAEWTERNLRGEQIASAGGVNHRAQKTLWRQNCSKRSAAFDAWRRRGVVCGLTVSRPNQSECAKKLRSLMKTHLGICVP